MTDDTAALADWCARLQDSGARGLLVLAGPADWSAALLECMPPSRDHAPLTVDPDTRLDRILGQDRDRVVFDARVALDVDRLGAAAGTVQAGGVLILRLPPLAQWRSSADPAMQRFVNEGADPGSIGDRFIRRFLRRLQGRPETALLTPDAPFTPPPRSAALPEATPADDNDCRTSDQARAVTAIIAAAQGRARRPLIVTADRGRGKSTALGLAAERLQNTSSPPRIAITAPSRGAAARALDRAPLPFLPADELLRHDHPVDVLLVDEAAGLPLPTLLALTRRYPRVVLASTVHGYEGTGRGFALRFRDTLRAAGLAPREQTLTTPVRWRAGDPLEATIADALLLDAEPSTVDGPTAVRIETVDRDRLAADEADLRAVFGLLVAAHYQTRPSDLRQLLDAPGLTVHVARGTGGEPLGVVLGADEGPLPGPLHEAIWLGERRLRGHLLPQSLATHAGEPAALARPMHRLLRVAVAPGHRRAGIGRALVEAVHRHCEAVDRLPGTSFGATPGLVRFWQACGLRVVRLGHRRDRASGTHAVIMLAPAAAGDLTAALRRGLSAQLDHHLPRAFADLEPELVATLATGLPITAPAAGDWRQTATFAAGRRGLLDCAPGLAAVVRWALAAQRLPAGEPGTASLVRVVLQQHAPSAAARDAGLAGRRALDARLRQAVLGLLRSAPPAARALAARAGRD